MNAALQNRNRITTCFDSLRNAVREHCGEVLTETIEPLADQGLSNITFRAQLKSGAPCKIRTHYRQSHSGTHVFEKEIWIAKTLSKCGLPSTEIYSGVHEYLLEESGRKAAFYVSEFIPGVPAAELVEHDAAARQNLYRNLGSLLRSIEKINCIGFGSSFTNATNSFTRSWEQSILEECDRYKNCERFLKDELTSNERRCFADRMEELKYLWPEPRLIHGDLSLRNVLQCQDSGELRLIDWEFAYSSAAPVSHFMLVLHKAIVFNRQCNAKKLFQIFYGDGITPELSALLTGYQISPVEYEKVFRRPTESLLASRLVPLLSWWGAMKKDAAVRMYWQNTYHAARGVISQLLK